MKWKMFKLPKKSSMLSNTYHQHKYFNISICSSLRPIYLITSHTYVMSHFWIAIPAVLLKMLQMKVALNVFRVKNMHSRSPSEPCGSWGEVKLKYVHYNISRGEAELHCDITLLGKVKPSYVHILKLTSMFHHLPSIGPKQLCTLAHPGCTCKAGTSWNMIKLKKEKNFPNFYFRLSKISSQDRVC